MGNKLKIVNDYHKKAIQGLHDMIREYAQQADTNTYPFEVTIMAFDRYAECDVPTPITINDIIVEGDNITICYDEDCEDHIELFSYDETYDILCNLCKKI